jgi:molecular chaperone GrpE
MKPEKQPKEEAAAPEASALEAEAHADAAVAMAKELAAKEAQNKDLYEQLLRLKAEFENYRKRVDREKPDLVRYGKGQLLERVLPLYDVLLAAHDQVLKADVPSADVVKGLEMIFKEFTKLFESEGVTVIESVGKPYDFHQHEVMGQVASAEHAEGTVVEELSHGYMLDGKVLRAAKVRVAKK